MSPYVKILCVLLISHFFVQQTKAQTLNTNNSLSVAPLTNEQKIQEVYGLHFFDNAPELYNAFLDIFNRVRYMAVRETPDEKYTHLDNIPLLDKINPNLVRDTNFDSDAFNPIKYQVEFFPKTTMIYRINQEYIMVISPRN